MDEAGLARTMRRQCGVVARRQVIAFGGDDLLIARMLRRREWAVVFEGVYVDHTGPLTRRQKAWAAVLVHDGAVLAGRDALEAHGIDRDRRRDVTGSVVEFAVDRSRRVDDPPGVRTRQLRDLSSHSLPDASPPRLRIEPAALLAASREPRQDGLVGVLADVVRGGHTTPQRLASHLERLPRLAGRRLMLEVLVDVGAGVESPMEHRYLHRVERAHGLPPGQRQVVERIEVVQGEPMHLVRRDVTYPTQRARVELDGRLGHDAALDRWADLDRDLAAAVHGSITLRAGWAQVLAPCRLAVLVGAILTTRGWTGTVRPCTDPACLARPARIA
jgi:hypothetical protein